MRGSGICGGQKVNFVTKFLQTLHEFCFKYISKNVLKLLKVLGVYKMQFLKKFEIGLKSI